MCVCVCVLQADRCFVAELFHGPTQAFKDFGQQVPLVKTPRLSLAPNLSTSHPPRPGAAAAAYHWFLLGAPLFY